MKRLFTLFATVLLTAIVFAQAPLKFSYQSVIRDASGKLVKVMGGSGSCGAYVDSYNEKTGRNTLRATDCFCEGYKDGLNGSTAKY